MEEEPKKIEDLDKRHLEILICLREIESKGLTAKIGTIRKSLKVSRRETKDILKNLKDLQRMSLVYKEKGKYELTSYEKNEESRRKIKEAIEKYGL